MMAQEIKVLAMQAWSPEIVPRTYIKVEERNDSTKLSSDLCGCVDECISTPINEAGKLVVSCSFSLSRADLPVAHTG